MWAHACKLTRVEVKMLQTFHGDNVSATLPSSWGTQGQADSLCWYLTYYTPLEIHSVFVWNLTWLMQQRAIKILVWLSWGTTLIFLLHVMAKCISCWCSQAIAAKWRIQHSAQPSTSLPKLRDGSAAFPTATEQCCPAAWSARTSFFKVHLHTLALRKGRAGIANVLLICITFFC